MCDICLKAFNELAPFLKQLKDKYPGTTVTDPSDNSVHPVSPSHHVVVALQAAIPQYLEEEVRFRMKERGEDENELNKLISAAPGKKEQTLH